MLLPTGLKIKHNYDDAVKFNMSIYDLAADNLDNAINYIPIEHFLVLQTY